MEKLTRFFGINEAHMRRGAIGSVAVMRQREPDYREERLPTTHEEAHRRVLSLLLQLESRLVDAGATAGDRAEWHRALNDDYHVRMFAGGYRELPISDVVGYYLNFVSAAKALAQTTIDRLEFGPTDEQELGYE